MGRNYLFFLGWVNTTESTIAIGTMYPSKGIFHEKNSFNPTRVSPITTAANLKGVIDKSKPFFFAFFLSVLKLVKKLN
jgi:hypothetical protein